MPDLNSIRVGLIGYGIGKLYAAALRSLRIYYPDFPPVELVSVATASETSARLAVQQSGFKHYTTDYHELLASDDLNVVVIATPHYLHHEMLVEALRTGKAIYTDKPLANNLAEAQDIIAVAHEFGRDAQISFVLRYCPAVRHARKLIQDGRLGEIYTFRLAYYRSSYSDPARSLRWKAEMSKSGGGVLSDLVPHLADLLIWLVGMPDRLTAQTRTFITERPVAKDREERRRIETDDHVIIQAALPGGSIGTIESGRLITGAVSNLAVEVYGSAGSLRWNMMDPHYLYFAERKRTGDTSGWLQIPAMQNYPDTVLPGVDIPVSGMGFSIASMADFLQKAREGSSYDPGLMQGLRVQAIIEAAAQAAREGMWVDILQV